MSILKYDKIQMIKNIYCSNSNCNNKLVSSTQIKFCSLSCSTSYKNTNMKNDKINSYNLNPKSCFHCNINLDYKNRKNKFCSSSCSAKCNNKNTHRGPKKKFLNKVEPCDQKKYPYSEVQPKICEYTNKIWWYNKRHRKLSPYRKTIKEQYYIRCKFKFNVYDYPDIFDLSLLDMYGWYTCPNKHQKNSIKNTNGLSRDHKVSIKEAFDNSYDPYYISHLLNCDLIKHKDNKKKHTNSSISYNELVRIVDDYDNHQYHQKGKNSTN